MKDVLFVELLFSSLCAYEREKKNVHVVWDVYNLMLSNSSLIQVYTYRDTPNFLFLFVSNWKLLDLSFSTFRPPRVYLLPLLKSPFEVTNNLFSIPSYKNTIVSNYLVPICIGKGEEVLSKHPISFILMTVNSSNTRFFSLSLFFYCF